MHILFHIVKEEQNDIVVSCVEKDTPPSCSHQSNLNATDVVITTSQLKNTRA